MGGPLAGVKIVELGQMIAVPAATFALAQQGASVVKIEDCQAGDPLRNYGSSKGGISGWFANANGGKQSIAVDLQSADGKSILWKLIADADVVIQGFRPGVMDRLGFGADEVLAKHPSIVYVSSCGYGLDGPYADRPVFDPVIQALSGWAGAQTTEAGPSLIRGMVADKVAALTSAQAISSALFARERTGVGQHLELSMLDANIAFNWPDVMMDHTVLDEDARHLPNLLGHYQLFETSDGWVSVTAGNDKQWQDVCGAHDRPDLAADERFLTAAGRGGNFQAWYGVFAGMLLAFTTDDVLRRCAASDVPAVAVLEPGEVVENEQVRAREAVREIDHPIIGRMRTTRPGVTFHRSGEGEVSPAPAYAQHTDVVLAALGYDRSAISDLRAAGWVK